MKKRNRIFLALMTVLSLFGNQSTNVKASESQSMITSTLNSELMTIDNNCTTEDGYSNVEIDLRAMEIYSHDIGSNHVPTFITFTQMYNQYDEIDSFVYLSVCEECNHGTVSCNYELMIFNIEEDNKNVIPFTLELVSKSNSNHLRKYKLINSSFNNLNNDLRKYNIKNFSYLLSFYVLGELKSNVAFVELNYNYNFNNNLMKYDGNNLILEDGSIFETNDIEDSNIGLLDPNDANDKISHPSRDFSNDVSFDLTKYPYKENNYILDVIQVAESIDKELIIYVYNPSKLLKANSINMEVDESGKYIRYYLKYINSSETIDKYIVNGLTINENEYRYYNITSIYRLFNPVIDKDNTSDLSYLDAIGHKVGKKWCLFYFDNQLFTEMEYEDSVEVDIKVASYVIYPDGVNIRNFLFGPQTYNERCISSFVGFNVDNYIVDKIYNADMEFTEVSLLYTDNLFKDEAIDKTTEIKNISLNEKEFVEYEGPGLWSKKFEWKRIMTAQEYIDLYEADGGELQVEKSQLNKCQWVFSYHESVLQYKKILYGVLCEKYALSYGTDATILRLEFLSQGKTYNLGVVSNAVGTTGEAAGTNDSNEFTDWLDDVKASFNDFMSWFTPILAIIGIVILISLLSPVLMFIMPVIKLVVSAVVKAVTLPFKLLNKKDKKNE